MIFASIILVLFAGAVYFHYLQGALTSVMSALSAACAVCIAFSYYEPITMSLAAGKSFVDSASAMMLCALFGITYIVLRIVFDAAVPGNVRMPIWVDRGVAVAAGLIASTLAVGTWAVAAQMMPFGANIGGYERYELVTRPARVPAAIAGARSDQDYNVIDEIKEEDLSSEKASGLLLPLDSMVMSFVYMVESGALEGDNKLANTTPDLLGDLFAQRLTVPTSTRRSAMTGKANEISFGGIYASKLGKFTAVDGELLQIREKDKARTLTAKGIPVVVRVTFTGTANDPDGVVRIIPGVCRIFSGGKNYYPVGTLQGRSTLVLNRLDDLLIIEMNKPVDFVFYVEPSVFSVKPDVKDKAIFAKDAFVEIKRYGRMSLSNRPDDGTPNDSALGVTRKNVVMTAIEKAGGINPDKKVEPAPQ